MQQELKDAVVKCEELEQKNKDRVTEMAKIKTEIQEAMMETRGAQQELHQVKQIAYGKLYLMQSVFSGNRLSLLT